MPTAKEPPRAQSELLSKLVLAVTAGAGLAGPACSSSRDFAWDAATGGFPASGGSTPAGGNPSDAVGGQTSAAGGTTTLGGAAGSFAGDGDSAGDGDGAGDGAGGALLAECTDRRAEMVFCSSREAMEHQARYGFYETPLDPPRSDQDIAAAFDENGCMRPDWVADGCCNAAIASGQPQDDGTCCYVSCAHACCGRPLIVAGQAREARPEVRADWCRVARLSTETSQLLSFVGEDVRASIAAAYIRDALLEHASVASFCRFALQLLGLGAPPGLIEAAHQAALDEVKHAQLCFGLASAIGNRVVGPSALPEAAAHLSTSARNLLEATIAEGCVGETISAALVREQAHVARDPLIREALHEIADDELRHAELSWKTVAWLMRVLRFDSFGHDIEALAAGAFDRAMNQPFSWPQLCAVPLDVANHFGRLSVEQAQCVRAVCLRDAIEPSVRHLLVETSRAASSRVEVDLPAV